MKNTKAIWTAHILTLFPEMFSGPINFSIIGKALEKKIFEIFLKEVQKMLMINLMEEDQV